MADAGKNRRSERQPLRTGAGSAGFGAHGMPLLAASAATRLAGQILARLQSPHASAHARAPHPAVLWREVTRRMGYAPTIATPIAAHTTGVKSFDEPPLSVPPAPRLVWRTRSAIAEPFEPDLPAWQSYRPNSVAVSRVMGESLPVPRHVAPQAERQERASEVQHAPPVLMPAVTVRIEYVPAPVSAPAPLVVAAVTPVAPPSLVPTVQRHVIERAAPIADVGRNLSSEVNRGIAPTTDLLSRMVRPAVVDLPVPSRVGERAAEPQGVPVQPMVAQSSAVAPSRPLAQPISGRAKVGEDVSVEPAVARPQGVFGRIIERIVEALPLPEAWRRAVQPGAQAPVRVEQVSRRTEPVGQVVASDVQTEHLPVHTQLGDAEAVGVPQVSGGVVASETGTTISQVIQEVEDSRTSSGSAERVSQVVVGEEERQEVTVNRGPGGLLSSLWVRLRGGDAARAEPPTVGQLTLPWISQRPSAALDDETAVVEDAAVPLPPVPTHTQPGTPTPVDASAYSDVAAVFAPAVEVPTNVQTQASEPTTAPIARESVARLPVEPGHVDSVPVVITTQEADSREPEILAQVGGVPQTELTDAIESTPVWEALPEMAQQVANSHAPLPEIVPAAAKTYGGFVARILARLGIAAPTSAPSEASAGIFEMILPRTERSAPQAAASGSALDSFASSSTVMPVMRMSTGDGASALVSTSVSNSSAVGMAGTNSVDATRYAQGSTAQRLNSMAARLAAMTAPLTVSRSAVAQPPFVGVLRSATQMLRIAQSSAEDLDGGSDSMLGAEDYIAALDRLYGEQASSHFPLAVPFANFASPAERQSYFESEDVGGGKTGSFFDFSSDMGMADYDFSRMANVNLSRPRAREAAEHSSPEESGEVSGTLTDYSWGVTTPAPTSSYEAGMWADVIASAAGGSASSTSSSVALALAGSERAAPEGAARPPNEDRAQGPNLDELADTIYSIIRQRLAIERERNFT